MRTPVLPSPSRQTPSRERLRPSRTRALLLSTALWAVSGRALLGCGGDGAPEPPSAPPVSTAPPVVPTAPVAPTAAGAGTGSSTAAPAGSTDALPEPVPPASWSTTLGELTVDGVTVRDVAATCGMFAMMPVVQVIAGATASCPDRAGVTVSAAFEGGQLRAVAVTGAGAECVRRAVVAASTGVSCQFQLTFGG